MAGSEGGTPPRRSTEAARIVDDEKARRGFVLLDPRKPSNRLMEHVVGLVVVDRRNLANEHVFLLGPERMPDAGAKRDALARSEAKDGAGGQDMSDRVRLDGHGLRLIEATVRVGHEEAHGERPAGPVDDIFRLQVVPVQWAGLARADDDHLFGIKHAATLAEFRQAAVSQGEKDEPVRIETAEAEVGDVPAEAPLDDP